MTNHLPNAHEALIDERKVVDYLLNAAHPDNGGEAAFFLGLGFSRQDPAALGLALLKLGVDGTVTREVSSAHGRKFIVDGVLRLTAGKEAVVRTVWIVDTGEDKPRLVTAYPGEGQGGCGDSRA